jgi:hypothetical protein
MKRVLATVLLLVFTLSAENIRDLKMTSMTFVIPSDKDTIVLQRNCQWCHSYGYILNQGKQSKEFWHKIVLKMRNTYKAPISQRDELLATEYLYRHFGK